MLYEMLTGKPPFSGDNAVQIALKHINEEMVPPSEASSGVPIALSDVVLRASAKDKAIRYEHAADMKRDLLRALKHPRSRFAKLRTGEETDPEEKSGGFIRFIKKHLGTVAIVTCVVAVIGIFAAMLLISVSSGRNSAYKSVPNLIGKTLEAAESSANYKGFTIEITGYEETEGDQDIILDQNPPAQEKAREGTVIKVVISKTIESVPVPTLIGMTVDEARNELSQYGLVLDEEYIDYAAGDQPEGTVIGQSPVAGETAIIGDSVLITVCKQPATVTFKVPDLISCIDVYAAAEALEEAGFENYRIHIITDADIEEAVSSTAKPTGSVDSSGDDDDEAYGVSVGSVMITIDSADELYGMQVVYQTPAAGTEVLYNTELIDVYVYRNSRGEYQHDFSENISLKAGDQLVVTITCGIGEVVIYESPWTPSWASGAGSRGSNNAASRKRARSIDRALLL